MNGEKKNEAGRQAAAIAGAILIGPFAAGAAILVAGILSGGTVYASNMLMGLIAFCMIGGTYQIIYDKSGGKDPTDLGK